MKIKKLSSPKIVKRTVEATIISCLLMNPSALISKAWSQNLLVCDNDFVKRVVELQFYLECLLTESLPVAELGVTDQAVLVPILIRRKLD